MPFANFFGKGKGKQPTPQEAIQKLRETEDMLNKKAEFLEKRIGMLVVPKTINLQN